MSGSLERLAAARSAVLRASLADRHTLERELGQGGMATVYLAHDIKHQCKVAVKVRHPYLLKREPDVRFPS
ncbi:MAG: hypothetical protein ACRELE_09165 [Gemmatimonadales bacterium]